MSLVTCHWSLLFKNLLNSHNSQSLKPIAVYFKNQRYLKVKVKVMVKVKKRKGVPLWDTLCRNMLCRKLT